MPRPSGYDRLGSPGKSRSPSRSSRCAELELCPCVRGCRLI